MKTYLISLVLGLVTGTFFLLVMTALQSCGPFESRGPQGQDGKSCTTSQVTNGVRISCSDGSASVVVNGLPGDAGPQGAPGQNAVSITVVQLCPNLGPTTYSGTFPEQALCISGNLYGVYWDGGQAFLAEIVPGVYTSTAPAGCVLTVTLNCVVTQN